MSVDYDEVIEEVKSEILWYVNRNAESNLDFDEGIDIEDMIGELWENNAKVVGNSSCIYCSGKLGKYEGENWCSKACFVSDVSPNLQHFDFFEYAEDEYEKLLEAKEDEFNPEEEIIYDISKIDEDLSFEIDLEMSNPLDIETIYCVEGELQTKEWSVTNLFVLLSRLKNSYNEMAKYYNNEHREEAINAPIVIGETSRDFSNEIKLCIDKKEEVGMIINNLATYSQEANFGSIIMEQLDTNNNYMQQIIEIDRRLIYS